MKKQNLFLILLLFLGNMIIYAQCSVNAGGNATICGTSYTLQGTSSGSTSGTPVWTLVSKPSGAPDPVISNVNSLTPNVTGMTSPGNYVFQVAQNCSSPSGTVTSQVTITAPGDAMSTFTAGPDITNVNATTGTVTLNGVVPNGYTASWSAYNIYKWERSGTKTSQNSQFSSTTLATTTFSLVNKANHDIDPAYVVTLRITANNNPNCWYEDTAIVRFIPNPQILPTVSTSRCVSGTGNHYVALQSTSPKFSKGYPSSPGSSGNFGTTVTMNVTSQPAGGNIAYSNIYDDNIFFTGVNVVGVYKFTLTITNSSGTYTTPELTYSYNGTQPNPVSFLTSSRPEQMMIYNSGNSGGEVHCGYAGQSTPITFYYTIDPADNPATINTSAASSVITPPGGAPVVTNGGAGTATRSATVTPPSGGWRVGTYKFTITRDNAGACSATQTYYIHISDGSRPNVTVPATTVCYPGSGVVTATIPLPAVYKGVVNSSYFQDFDGRYRLTLVSKPAGAADPVFEPYANTLFTNTSTTISNLNMQGEYVFKIKADTYNTSVGAFLDKEYACSGTSQEGTFSVFVMAQVGANAGSAQTLIGTSQTTFNANNPGAATGTWTLLTKPSGATDPVIATPSAYNTSVTGFNTPGTYTFRWTVTTGTCTSTSDLTVSVINAAAGGVSGADFWVKSDDAGTIATAWKDHSINANDIPAVGTWTLSAADRSHNFNPYTTGYSASKFFYNSASVMNSTNGELANTNTSIFSAVRPTTNGTGRITGIDDDVAYASEPGVSIANGAPRQYEYYNIITSTDFSTTFNIGISNIFSAIANNSVANGGTSASLGGEKILGLNGSYQTTPFAGTNKFQIYGRNLRIGHAGWDAPGAFPGDIMEVVWYKRTLTANEQSRVNSYLAVKNGVTLNENYLSTNSNVVWDRTVNTGYNNNIFGIARDNITVLHQKQSGSVNDGQKLVISTTGFADSNIANATGLANDLQYLMTGDNGLRQELKTLLTYTGGTNGEVNSRFESIWKVQNSGNIGTVTVAWPKGVKNLYLVQSSDAVFEGTDTFTPMITEVTVNGVVYNTANVILANGQYFTFAGYSYAPGGVFSAAWYRADGVANLFSDAGVTSAADNAVVQQWNEFNGKPFPLSQATANLRPEFSNATTLVNFNPTVNYTTSSKWLQYDGNALGNIINRSTGALFSAGNTTGTTAFFGFGASATNVMDDPGLYNYTGNKFLFYPIIGEYDPVSTYTINGPYIGGGTWQNGAGVAGNNAVDITLNGFHQTYNTGISNVTTATDRNALMAGGAETSVAFQQNEMIVFPSKLTDQETNRVESYLAIKYGHTLSKEQNRNYLSSAGTVVWDGSTSDYYNNVFGIARDNISALYQKQSRSINDGQKLIIGAGNSLVDTNAANTNTLADGQFLLTGDNGLKQSLTTPLAYTAGSNGAVNYRFESIWKVQNSGSVGTVTVAWPKGVKNLYLVQSSDAAFDATDTFTPMTTEVTVNGVVYNTANVTLGNGQFFTFAGFGNAPGGVVSGLSYWYRADKNAANTGAATDVTGWTDVWNGTTVAQLGTNTLPKYVLGAPDYFNFNPGINFTVGTQTLGNNTVRTLTSLDYDVFTLTKEGMASGGGNPRLFSVGMDNTTLGAANWDAFGIFPNATNLERRPYGGGTQFPGVNPAFNATIPSIMYFKNTNTTSAKGLNGAAMNTAVNYAAVNAQYGGHIFGNTVFSGNGSDNAGFIGHIGETIVYGAGTLTTAERRRVDSYLAIKYGITLGQVNTDHYLDTAGNIVWNGASNATYNNNIFGVTRDDIEMLEQKVSKSVNAGTILTVATTNDFVNPNNNAARTSFANDKTYFLLGDNNIATTTLSSITINGFTGGSRIPRIWLAQRTNTSGTMYFGADLSSYGGGFGSGDQVKMIIADDAAFTTNVVYVNGTYDVTAGKWVHSYNFDSGNANRYITYATVDEVACTTGSGCNNNTYLNATNPSTIEYDNLVAGSSAILAKEKDGTFKIWGYRTGPTSVPTNANLPIDLLVPTAITPANGFTYTGTPLKATLVSASALTNSALLTTDGLYTWGDGGYVISNVHKDTNTGLPTFSKVTVNGKADGLPPGVSPINVKMMFGVYQSLVIVTCSGQAWVLTSVVNQNYYGDGMVASTANSNIWHRVKISATETLDNVVAVRGNDRAKFALTSDGKLYTWGLSTLIGDGSSAANRAFATQVTLPSGITPKMIGMTGDGSSAWNTYFLLATNGKLFAMGSNAGRMLGDGTTTNSNLWKEVTATSGSNTLGGNIVWMSASEAGYTLAPAINVLTNDKKQWGWGSNQDYKLGQASTSTDYNPTYMPGNTTNTNGMGLNDEIIALETGGRFTMNYKNGNPYFGIVGSTDYGTMGNGSTGLQSQQKYTYNTAVLDLCMLATPVAGLCYKPGILTGTTLDTKAGITALSRAGTNSDNWPMVRKGGWIALESKTKAFVPNRVAFDGTGNPVGIAPANFVEGMMVYDTTNKCMKMYTLKEGDTSMAWHCISTQTCPD